MYDFSKRLVAVTFIGLIVLGNIWVIFMFTGGTPPAWTATAFLSCLVFAVIGALGLLIDAVRGYFAAKDAE